MPSPVPVRAIFSEIGTHNYELDPTDRWMRFDFYMQKKLAFELIQGHQLIADSDMAMMWERKSQKVLENMIWLDHANSKHGISIAPSFVAENILVAENSSSIRLTNPDGFKIDGAGCYTSDGLQAAMNLYFKEVKKNQPFVTVPLDLAEFRDKVVGLARSMLTQDELEEYLYDASFLDDSGLTAALHHSNGLLRSSYISSNHPDDIVARATTLTAVTNLVCRDGNRWMAYLSNLPITSHFYNETVKKSQHHIAVIKNAPLQDRPILQRIQEGHNQVGAQRNTGVHLNDKKNIGLFQHVITPSPTQIIKPQQKVILPRRYTVSSDAISKYNRFHFPLTTGTIFHNMRQFIKSKDDLNQSSFFVSERIPRT